MYDLLLMFESPVQWMIVLVIALIVFGPKRLPEIGKQIGSALRELRKATGDVMRSMNTDYEPDPPSYSSNSYTNYSGYSAPENTYAYSPETTSSPPDLTDYTIVDKTQVAQTGGSSSDGSDGRPYDDYRISPSALTESVSSNGQASGAGAATSVTDKEGEKNV
jgi:sec-independent protein translocase protein TatA